MTPKARLFVSLLATGMVGIWLNACAMMTVAAANGLPGVPSPFLEIIYLACWPSALIGVPHEEYFDPGLGRKMAWNVLCWTAIGIVPMFFWRRRRG